MATCSVQHRLLPASRINLQRLAPRRNFQKYGNDLKKERKKIVMHQFSNLCFFMITVYHAAFQNKNPEREKKLVC